jgi:hypothetical protein
MSIKTKDWVAQINRMPGNAWFGTFGTVVVPTPSYTPVLELDPMQDKSFDLRLILKLEHSDTISAQVVTEKRVTYKVSGNSNVSGVSIYYKDELLHHIDDVLVTH